MTTVLIAGKTKAPNCYRSDAVFGPINEAGKSLQNVGLQNWAACSQGYTDSANVYAGSQVAKVHALRTP
jgi:hypothetical protein